MPCCRKSEPDCRNSEKGESRREKQKKAQKKKQKSQKNKQSQNSKKSYAEAVSSSPNASEPNEVKDDGLSNMLGISMDDILEAMVESIMEIACNEFDPAVRAQVAASTMEKVKRKVYGKNKADVLNEVPNSDATEAVNDAKMEVCEISDLHEKSTEKSNLNSDFHVQKQKFGPHPTPLPNRPPRRVSRLHRFTRLGPWQIRVVPTRKMYTPIMLFLFHPNFPTLLSHKEGCSYQEYS